jgi:RNA polymerase sigma factor (TIGR02999 family)
MSKRADITSLLQRYRKGDKAAAEELLPLVYGELKRLAASRLKHERPGHTLQPTALVHEVYLKLAMGTPVDWQDRAHFLAVAAQHMRRIIVDHARAATAGKRGGGHVRISLDDFSGVSLPRDASMLALDEALTSLKQIDERAAKVVELRFFGGLTEQEVAEALGIGITTMKRDWKFARAWLGARLCGAATGHGE